MSYNDRISSFEGLAVLVLLFSLQPVLLTITPPVKDMQGLVPIVVRYGFLSGIGAYIFGLLADKPIRSNTRKMIAGLLFGTVAGYFMDLYLNINLGYKELISFGTGLCVETSVNLFKKEFIARLLNASKSK